MRSDPGARGASRGVTCIRGLRPVFLRLGVGLVGLEERGRGRHAGSGGRDDEDRRASVTARARMRPRSAPGLDVFAKAHCPPPVGNPAPGEKHAQKRPRRGTCPSVRSWAENQFPGTCIGAWGAGHSLPAPRSARTGGRGDTRTASCSLPLTREPGQLSWSSVLPLPSIPRGALALPFLPWLLGCSAASGASCSDSPQA